MYKPNIQLVLPYGPSTWGQHLCQSLFSCICISWDMQRSVVMCSEYYMRTDLGHNLTRMDRCTAISEYSNFLLWESSSFNGLGIYLLQNSTTDEAYKQYSNNLYTSNIKTNSYKKLQVYEIVFCTWFFMHFAQRLPKNCNSQTLYLDHHLHFANLQFITLFYRPR